MNLSAFWMAVKGRIRFLNFNSDLSGLNRSNQQEIYKVKFASTFGIEIFFATTLKKIVGNACAKRSVLTTAESLPMPPKSSIQYQPPNAKPKQTTPRIDCMVNRLRVRSCPKRT